ncbi:Cytochrome b5 reductase 4 [Leucoagaricus sp. SymC.cos]|nr:Cytochrome b5 reductase 4 [Leucoagaricus sp. SymC.cos]
MTSYLRGWLSAGMSAVSTMTTDEGNKQDVLTVTRHSPPPDEDDDDGSATETERDHEDDDAPPAFPSLNSTQRVHQQLPPSTTATGPLPKVLTDAQLMPPPPIPSSRLTVPGASRVAPGSLAVPPTTTKRPSKKREKVVLAPGHSPMDWANLKASGKDLRGVPTLSRITPSILKQHNNREDAWTAINGKVYNITPYIEFHPGGEKELMRVAGRDGTKLFALTHAWVSADMMLDACLVGFLIPESSSKYLSHSLEAA